MKIVINLKTLVVVEDAEYNPSNDEVDEFFYKLLDSEGLNVKELETSHYVGGKYLKL